ncbi:hypothetical protein CHX27_13025 [Flavobacterium aurantiibacter]|uniref:Uncharacterized protein n=1 Tax=Flavobacterium aurantiibacter TaxID=2023067 RepID=A0A255ZLI0_9FLAO|nr:hypothetical protein CHX27_13025 [Flavobacterium aurantiibacter]
MKGSSGKQLQPFCQNRRRCICDQRKHKEAADGWRKGKIFVAYDLTAVVLIFWAHNRPPARPKTRENATAIKSI